MDLKYWEKSEGRTPYDYEINSKFDPFDKTDENNLATKTGRKLNMSSILIKPKYGEVFTSQNPVLQRPAREAVLSQTLKMQ